MGPCGPTRSIFIYNTICCSAECPLEFFVGRGKDEADVDVVVFGGGENYGAKGLVSGWVV